MKNWAYSVFSESVRGEPVLTVLKVMQSDAKPPDTRISYDEYSFREGWAECPHDVGAGWILMGEDSYFNPLFLGRIKRDGFSVLPQSKNNVKFKVYNFFGMDNYRTCYVNVDVNSHGVDDVARMLLSYYKGGFNLGVGFQGGDPDSPNRLFRSITRLTYTNFSAVEYIDRTIRKGDMDSRHFKNLLWAAVAENTVAKIPAAQKMALTSAGKTLSEYNLDPTFPIVAKWALEPGQGWGVDWADIGLDFVFDFVTELVDAAV
ncbi:hypothetical protein ACI77N_05075 [Pseudomonas sp. S191]|uniref:hypothetical protein n=1 Tax=Pseudomonas sp. S191 TaxID=579575 RepID=UPI00387B52C9